MPPGGRERTGYPTQKPLGVLSRILKVHSAPGDTVIDSFAGSGTTGAAAAANGRGYVLIDRNPEAIAVMEEAARYQRGGEPVELSNTTSNTRGQSFPVIKKCSLSGR